MQYQAKKKALGLSVLSLLLLCLDRGSGKDSMPRPQWTVEQCRLYGRKGGRQRKGKKVRSEDYIAGFSAGYKAGRAERKRAGMTEKTKDQNECLLGNTAGEDSRGQSPVAATRFTPGPWSTEVGFGCAAEIAVVESDVFDAIEIYAETHASTQEEQHANARLIAAAPEMVELLQAIHCDTSTYHWHRPIRALLTKIQEGQP